MKKKATLLVQLVKVQRKLVEKQRKLQEANLEINLLTAAISDLESRKAAGLNTGVVCCGCGRGLKHDGELTIYSVLQPLTDASRLGVIDFSKLKELKGFVSTVEADEFALTHSWQIADTDGPNHRCPDCVKKEAEKGANPRRGAYIDLANGNPAGP